MKNSVDVVIPAYNAEKFILKTLKSVEVQTVKINKIIVVDDGSTDNTFDVVKNFSRKSITKIVLLEQENKGPSSARNLGIKHSNAEFVAFVDADDVWKKDKIEKQLKIFAQSDNKKVGVVYSLYSLIDANDNQIIHSLVFDESLKGNVLKKLLLENKVSGSASSVLIKKEVFETVGFFDENMVGSEDWDFWIRISKKYEFDYVKEKLVFIRQHNNNNQKLLERMFRSTMIFYNKWGCIFFENGVVEFHKLRILKLILQRIVYSKRIDFFKMTKNLMSFEAKKCIFQNDNLFFVMFKNLHKILIQILKKRIKK